MGTDVFDGTSVILETVQYLYRTTTVPAAAIPTKEAVTERNQKPKRQPRYSVRLWDDDKHTFIYVIHMMRELFGFTLERAQALAEQVDASGSAVCLTTTLEHAELKRDQIHAYGKDQLINDCKGSMSCSIEPVE